MCALRCSSRALTLLCSPRLASSTCTVPTLILPPLVLTYLQRKRVVPVRASASFPHSCISSFLTLLQPSPLARTSKQTGLWARAADLSLIGASLLVFLPPAIATFPQTATIDVRKLEDRFQNLKDAKGQPLTTVEFNKGL